MYYSILICAFLNKVQQFLACIFKNKCAPQREIYLCKHAQIAKHHRNIQPLESNEGDAICKPRKCFSHSFFLFIIVFHIILCCNLSLVILHPSTQ